MSAQSTARSPKTSRRSFNTYVGIAAFVLSLGLIALGASRALQQPATRAEAPVSAPASLANDAAQQGVMGYIQAHENLNAPIALANDAAHQGTMGYIQAHAFPQATISADPAHRAVLDYLRAHGVAVD